MTRLKQAWLALCVVGLAGCRADGVGTGHLQVLVCQSEGRETYRSPPSSYWRYSADHWFDAGWNNRYRQSAFESCHTEPAK